jgi:hypothetical protein
MSRERCITLYPEDLSLLGTVYDRLLASLPPCMRTPSNRIEIAKKLIGAAANGERDPTELELVAAINQVTTVAA